MINLFEDRLWFSSAVAIYGVAFVYALIQFQRATAGARSAVSLVTLGFIFHNFFLIQRGAAINHCPITNAFEMLAFVTWAIVGIYLVVQLFFRLRFLSLFILAPVVAIGLAALMLPKTFIQPTETSKGVYFGLHVAVMMLSYGAFALAGAAGVMYLLQEGQLKSRHLKAFFHLLPSIEKLDRLNINMIMIGLVLLTIGIVAGFLWNRELPQKLGETDPRIIASAVVWMLYAVLLAARWIWALRGRKIAIVSVVAAVMVLITLGLTHNRPNL